MPWSGRKKPQACSVLLGPIRGDELTQHQAGGKKPLVARAVRHLYGEPMQRGIGGRERQRGSCPMERGGSKEAKVVRNRLM